MSEIRLRKKRRWPIIAIFLILLTGIIIYCGYQQDDPDKPVADDGIQDMEAQQKTEEDASVVHKADSIHHKEQYTGTDEITNSSDAEKDTAWQEISSGQQNEPSQKDDNSQSKGHWETRYETIPAWDEQIIEKDGWYETVLVREAWDEEVWDDGAYYGADMEEVAICSGCGAVFHDSSINQHLEDHPEHGGWYNDFIAVSEPYWHGTKSIVHHEAEYKQVWHEPEYRTVHHPEETRSYQVWVDD